MSPIEQPHLNSSWQWQCNIHLVGLCHTKERNSPLFFYLEKLRFPFLLPHKKHPQEWNDTEILCVWKGASSTAQAERLCHQLCSSSRQRERQAEQVRGERVAERRMCTTGHSHTTLFPPGTRWPARSSHSFFHGSSCASRSCSLKKDTYPCFLFSYYFLS